MTGPAVRRDSMLGLLGQLMKYKLQLRGMIASRGLAAAEFWLLAVVVASWLNHVGLRALVIVLAVLWTLLILPILYLELSLIADMLGYVFTGRLAFFPIVKALMEAKTEEEQFEIQRELLPPPLDAAPAPMRPAPPSRFWNVFAFVLSLSSPLSCFSMWALAVLVRIPESAHHRATSPKRLIALQREAGGRVYEKAVARLSLL